MHYRSLVLRFVLTFALSLCCEDAAGAALRPTQQPSPFESDADASSFERYVHTADAAIDAAKRSDTATAKDAAEKLAALIAEPYFVLLPRQAQRSLISAQALAMWRQGELAIARSLFEQATRTDPNDPDDWYWLAGVEAQLGNSSRAAHYVSALLKRWPELANNLDAGFLGALVFRGAAASPARTDLMQALFDAGWDDRGLGTDQVWHELALSLLAAGDVNGAAAVAAAVTDPLVLVSMRSDKRFDALAPFLQSLPDVRAAAERRVDVLGGKASAAPQRVDLAVALGTALLVAGRHEEALAAADKMLAAIASADPASFEKLEQQVWVRNNRAIALRRLGRHDDAVAEFEQASRLDENGATNISQALNLASLYCQLERPRDALRTLGRVGTDISPYGRMVRAAVRHCAAVQLRNRSQAAEALAFLHSRRRDGILLLIDAHLREARLDEAAEVLIAGLDDPARRAQVLTALQEFRKSPELPGSRALNGQWRALKARADVQVAIAEVGRTDAYDVYDLTGID